MSDFPQQPIVTPTHINSIGNFSAALAAQGLVETATIQSMASVGEKLAAYIPVYIPYPYPVARVWWINGSAAGGNTDFAIYNKDGQRLVSAGSTTATGNNTIQYVDTTDILISPGPYYFALVNESATTTNRWFGFSNVATSQGRISGLLQQASVFPLPSSATFAAWASTGLPICGITKTSSGL